MPRTLAVLVAALLLSGIDVGVTAAPVSAASCYGYSCHGLDPTAYGCSTSSTAGPQYVKLQGTNYAVVYNRYSTHCNANWASAQLEPPAIAAGFGLEVEISTRDHNEFMCYWGPSNTGHLVEDCYGPYYRSLQAYTDMVDGTHVTDAQVCLYDNVGRFIDCSPLASQ